MEKFLDFWKNFRGEFVNLTPCRIGERLIHVADLEDGYVIEKEGIIIEGRNFIIPLNGNNGKRGIEKIEIQYPWDTSTTVPKWHCKVGSLNEGEEVLILFPFGLPTVAIGRYIIQGQWDYKNNYSPTMGVALEYLGTFPITHVLDGDDLELDHLL